PRPTTPRPAVTYGSGLRRCAHLNGDSRGCDVSTWTPSSGGGCSGGGSVDGAGLAGGSPDAGVGVGVGTGATAPPPPPRLSVATLDCPAVAVTLVVATLPPL